MYYKSNYKIHFLEFYTDILKFSAVKYDYEFLILRTLYLFGHKVHYKIDHFVKFHYVKDKVVGKLEKDFCEWLRKRTSYWTGIYYK